MAIITYAFIEHDMIEETITSVIVNGDPCERCFHTYGEHYTQNNQEKYGCAHVDPTAPSVDKAICFCNAFAIRLSDLSLYVKRIGSLA